ncbi:MAG: hypothetical protein HZA74_12365 [Ignavibacteriales bacterium]|nr:hypothetical protein [Ignavibacteriales bacterium]
MKRIFVLLIFLMFCTINFAQQNLSSISLKLGIIRNFQDQNDNVGIKTNAFYTEFEVGGKFFIGYLNWSFNIGYFDEKIDSPIPIADYETINHKNYTIGLRLLYNTLELFGYTKNLKLYITAGGNYNIRNNKNISNMSISSATNTDYYFQPYLGLQANLELYKNSLIIIELGDNVGVNNENLARYVLMIGFKYEI